MHNPSDIQVERGAKAAGEAQFLRGRCAFGAVAFHQGVALTPDRVWYDPGYADCLPILGGGCWRDPAHVGVSEASR